MFMQRGEGARGVSAQGGLVINRMRVCLVVTVTCQAVYATHQTSSQRC